MADQIDTSKLTSIEDVDASLVPHKDNYIRKAKLYDQIKQSKNDTNAAYRDQLKEIREQMDEEMAAVSVLEDHKKLLSATTE